MRATSKGRAEDRPDDSMQSDAAESRWGSGGVVWAREAAPAWEGRRGGWA